MSTGPSSSEPDDEFLRRDSQAGSLLTAGFALVAAGIATIVATDVGLYLIPLIILAGGGALTSILAGITLHTDLASWDQGDSLFNLTPGWYTKAALTIIVLTVQIAAISALIVCVLST